MSSFFLPEELMPNIWLRLPIKSTVRFRCVSKSWCSSLSDPQFIYKNLTLSNAEKQSDLLMVVDWDREHYSAVSHETLVPSPLRKTPISYQIYTDELLAYSCHDLVCFHNGYGNFIGVWNFTTGETKILPRVSNELFDFVALGFGFDDQIQDYKIVQIGFFDDAYEVYVYSLRSGNNCWRKLDKPNVPIIDPIGECWSYFHSYRDGIFYWCDYRYLMVSFDMSSEVFNTISIPRYPHLLGKDIYGICKLKGSSSMLIVICSLCDDHLEYDLWALLDVGVTQSLTKLFRIDWHLGNEVVYPLGFWRNELVFLCVKNRLLIGDPSSKRERKECLIDESLKSLSCVVVCTKGKNSVP